MTETRVVALSGVALLRKVWGHRWGVAVLRRIPELFSFKPQRWARVLRGPFKSRSNPAIALLRRKDFRLSEPIMPQYSLLCGVFGFINFHLRRKRPLSKMAAPELQAVLEQLLEPDNAVIQQATARLREAFADPRTPERLAEIVVGAARPQLRQLAAVLLRRRLSGGRWRCLDPELRLRLPSLLAEALEKETDRSVLPSLSHVGAVLLRRGGAEAWAPMGQWVQRAARDPHLQERALQVLSAALEDPPPSLTPHCRPIAELCRGGLQPGTPPHSTAYALKALGGLAAALGGTQTDLLRSLLPDVLRALQALIDADEELGAAALEVLDEFVAADPKAVTFDLRPVLDLCLQVGGAEGRGQAVRARALAVLGFLAQERPRALQPFLPPLLGSLLTLLCSPPPRDHPDPEDAELWGGGEGGRSIRHCAAQVLNALALGVPAEKLLREMVPRLEPLLGSPEPWGRKGALLALGAAADGCGELLRRSPRRRRWLWRHFRPRWRHFRFRWNHFRVARRHFRGRRKCFRGRGVGSC